MSPTIRYCAQRSSDAFVLLFRVAGASLKCRAQYCVRHSSDVLALLFFFLEYVNALLECADTKKKEKTGNNHRPMPCALLYYRNMFRVATETYPYAAVRRPSPTVGAHTSIGECSRRSIGIIVGFRSVRRSATTVVRRVPQAYICVGCFYSLSDDAVDL